MKKKINLIVVMIMLYGNVAWTETMYSWIDENGVKKFGDAPSLGAQQVKEIDAYKYNRQQNILNQQKEEQQKITNGQEQQGTTKPQELSSQPQIVQQQATRKSFSKNCEIVSISTFKKEQVEGGHISGGVVVGNRIHGGSLSGGQIISTLCATISVKNTGSGSRLSGKLILHFVDGSEQHKNFICKRVSEGESAIIETCWKGHHVLDYVDCEF